MNADGQVSPPGAAARAGAGRKAVPPKCDGFDPDEDAPAQQARRRPAARQDRTVPEDSFAVLAADPFEEPAEPPPEKPRRARARPASPAVAGEGGPSAQGRANGETKPAGRPPSRLKPKAPRPRPEALVLSPERPPSNAALIGRLLTGVVLLGLLVGGVVVAAQWEPRLLPIRSVVVNGEMHGLSRESLQEAIASHITGGFLTQSLSELKVEVEGLPWIDRVSLRRVWPDRIEVRVSEHEAHARWGENGLVTAGGVVFRPRDGRVPAGLALLEAPDDALAPEVVRHFQDWGTRLVSVGLILEGVRRDARGDWTLKLLGGTEVLLGTEDLEARLARLLAAYPQVEAIGVPARLDLRYSNGLAVRWVPIVNSGAVERVATNPDRQRS